MAEQIAAFFTGLPEELIVFLISLLPIVELRGAIPVGALVFRLPFYSNYLLSVVGNILPVPFILLFIPKILDFLARFKLFRPMVEWLRKKADKNSAKVLGKDSAEQEANAGDSTVKITAEEAQDEVTAEAAAEAAAEAVAEAAAEAAAGADKADAPKSRRMSRSIFLALLIFVAVPLPGTGAWTGSLVASLFYLPRWQSFLAVLLGVLLSGVIMTLASYGVLGFLNFLL